MSVEKRLVDDPSDTGKLNVFRDLEERVLKDFTAQISDSEAKSGKGIIEAALTASDTRLLRNIAAERKGLTDPQRRVLLLVADLLDRAAARHSDQAWRGTHGSRSGVGFVVGGRP